MFYDENTPPTMSTRGPRTVVVCLPPDFTGDLAAHGARIATFQHTGTDARFGVRTTRWARLTGRSARNLIDPQRRGGRVTAAAGGRKGHLDLKQPQHTGYYAAYVRFDAYTEATDGTKPADGWTVWCQRIADQQAAKAKDPKAKDPLTVEQAWKHFLNQPRVAAMLVYSALPGRVQIDPLELEMFQAGGPAYAVTHQLRALCGDAVITHTGRHLRPAGPSIAAHTAYLKQAAAYLCGLGDEYQVVALTA